MKRVIVSGFGTAAIVLSFGCGSTSTTAPADTPLTVKDWQAMPVQAKYEIATLERLKLGNPKLQNQREWDRFTRQVLLPAKKKDRPELAGR